jgi:hypothetical protein
VRSCGWPAKMGIVSADLSPPKQWRTPEQLVAFGFQRSRVVMMNEAHDGLRRCIRTRRIAQRVLPTAHQAGVRHLAMEALTPSFAEEANSTREVPDAASGYLTQPEMRDLIAAALNLGWRLVAYEADFNTRSSEFERLSREETNWREDQQAHNLSDALSGLSADHRLLVWCGNHHLAKHGSDQWRPMGSRFRELTGIEPFAIDQTVSVDFGAREPFAQQWVESYANEITSLGGAAGFLANEAPDRWASPEIADAFILALENTLV